MIERLLCSAMGMNAIDMALAWSDVKRRAKEQYVIERTCLRLRNAVLRDYRKARVATVAYGSLRYRKNRSCGNRVFNPLIALLHL
jgi:hypothetical protein